MTEIDTGQASPPSAAPQPWGYLSTFGWVLLVHVVASLAAVAVLLAWDPSISLLSTDIGAMMKDARVLAVSTIVANAIQIALLAFIASRRQQARDYLAVNWPARPEVAIALISLAVLLPLLDLASWLAGQPIVPAFQTDLYNSALASGTLPLLLLAIVVAAPVAEEIIFRGFIFRGWVRPPRFAIPGILVTTALFAVIHVQYNWFGIVQVFCIGLLLTWTRWRSGSMLLPMAMHVIANAYAMLQTAVLIHWLS